MHQQMVVARLQQTTFFGLAARLVLATLRYRQCIAVQLWTICPSCASWTRVIRHKDEVEEVHGIVRAGLVASLKAAMFGTVCLSSLLPSPLHVFALMLTAVAMFAVLPNARMALKVCTCPHHAHPQTSIIQLNTYSSDEHGVAFLHLQSVWNQ